MISGAAILPIMVVVRHQVGIDARRLQQLGQGAIKRLQWPPAAMQKIDPPGMQITPRRHTGQAAHKMGVEGDRTLGKTLEIRRGYRFTSVALQCSAHQ